MSSPHLTAELIVGPRVVQRQEGTVRGPGFAYAFEGKTSSSESTLFLVLGYSGSHHPLYHETVA